jgi:hypothetical protein
MAGNAINAKSEALDLHELSSGDLDAVSGGFFGSLIRQAMGGQNAQGGGQGGQNDPAQMFQQIMQQLTQGQG